MIHFLCAVFYNISEGGGYYCGPPSLCLPRAGIFNQWAGVFALAGWKYIMILLFTTCPRLQLSKVLFVHNKSTNKLELSGAKLSSEVGRYVGSRYVGSRYVGRKVGSSKVVLN